MHVVIMGCGRVGAMLAHRFEDRGHTVAVIDRDGDSFRRLGVGFRGDRVTGIGFDQNVLNAAGIEQAGAFAAVSSGDNSNIITARVVRERFGVENVVARIYDPRRAEVYERLGIPTVATVRWTANQMLRQLLPEGAEPQWRDSSGSLRMDELHVPEPWVGSAVSGLERTGARVAYVTRLDEAVMARPDLRFQDGDVLHLIVADADRAAVNAAIDNGPQEA